MRCTNFGFCKPLQGSMILAGLSSERKSSRHSGSRLAVFPLYESLHPVPQSECVDPVWVIETFLHSLGREETTGWEQAEAPYQLRHRASQPRSGR